MSEVKLMFKVDVGFGVFFQGGQGRERGSNNWVTSLFSAQGLTSTTKSRLDQEQTGSTEPRGGVLSSCLSGPESSAIG